MSLAGGQKKYPAGLPWWGWRGGSLHSPAGIDTVHPNSIRRNTMQFTPSGTFPALTLPMFMERVQAGFPSPAQGYEQKGIDLNELMVANPPATYFVRAQGDSMLDAGIRDGDMLVVDFSRQSKHGDIVIAKLDDSFTVKRLYKRRSVIRLCSENKEAGYEPIVPQEGQILEIIGVVRWIIHQCQ